MPKAPEQLIEQTTRHVAFAERLKSGYTKELLELFEDIETFILGQLARSDITTWTRRRLERQLRGYSAAMKKLSQEQILARLEEQIREFALEEVEFENRSLQNVAPNVNFTLPSAAQALAAVRTNPLSVRGPDEGKLLDEYLDAMTERQIDQTNRVIRAGFGQGLTNAQVIRNMRTGLILARRDLETMARTALQHVANRARESVWHRNSDIVRRVRWTATLDRRTSVQCRALDGQTFPLDSGPRPPIHQRCRSTIVAVLDERFSFLDEGATRFSRDPQTGRAQVGEVGAETTYYGWLRRQPASVQNGIIGEERGILLRNGGLTSDRFAELQLDRNFQPISIEKMRELEPLAFERAGL